MATERKAPDESSSQIPDLEVRAKGPSTATAPAPAASADIGTSNDPSPLPGFADVQDYFGSGTFDADHFGDVGATLETSGTIATAPRVVQAWPTGRSPDGMALVIDAVEVRLAADYGPPPTNPVVAPIYAARVFRRRSDLRGRVKQLGDELERSERDRDDLLVSAILELRGKVLLTEGGEDLFAPVVEIERLALDRRSALAGANAEYERRASEIEDNATALRAEAARTAGNVDAAAAVLAKHRQLFERASAKKKRLYIEIRAILDTAEKSGGDLTPQQAARVAELEGAVAAHNPELERAEQAVSASAETHAAAEAESKHIARRIAEAGRLRRALDDEFKTQIGVRSEGVSETERHRADALAEVMRKILAARGHIVEVSKETLDGIARADQAVHARALELQKVVLAMDSYDASAYRRGIVIAGIAIALLLAGIAARVLL